MPPGQGKVPARSRVQRDIEVQRVGRGLRDRSAGFADRTGDDLHAYPRRRLHYRDPLGREFLVLRLRHLVLRRQVHPQLETAHPAFVLLRHFRMHQAAASGHPLHAAGRQQAFVAVVVAMAHAAVEHVGDGLEAAVRVLREAGEIVLGAVGAELVQQQERVEVGQCRPADDACQAHAGTIGRGLAAQRAHGPGIAVGSESGHGKRSCWLRTKMAPPAVTASDAAAEDRSANGVNQRPWRGGCTRTPSLAACCAGRNRHGAP